MIEIIRLLVVWMHMRALDEAAFVDACPIGQCQWKIFNRTIECWSPGATTMPCVSNQAEKSLQHLPCPSRNSLLEHPDASVKQFLRGRAKSVLELFGQIPWGDIYMRIRTKWVPIG